jgi:hypothetical protein
VLTKTLQSARPNPTKKSAVVHLSFMNCSIILESAKLAGASSGNIKDPGLFVLERSGQKREERGRKMVVISRREVSNTIEVFIDYMGMEKGLGSDITTVSRIMDHSVAMVPLCPSQVVKCSENLRKKTARGFG